MNNMHIPPYGPTVNTKVSRSVFLSFLSHELCTMMNQREVIGDGTPSLQLSDDHPHPEPHVVGLFIQA